MITLSFLKLLEDAGFGTIDKDLFFQKLSLDKKGVYIADIGDPQSRGSRNSQSFELYSRGNNDVEGYRILCDIRNYLIDNYSSICTLPSVPPVTTKSYKNIVLMKPSAISNVGVNDQGRVVYSITSQIIY